MRLIDVDKLIKTIEEDEPTNKKANEVICLCDEIISAFERVGEEQK